ncbi:MAG: hypothetical protein Q6362_011945 [Candidatus Wukongarchaeota archaeon]|nr:hypothetical protein [Candidatus Wukongarchaeota archaeon]
MGVLIPPIVPHDWGVLSDPAKGLWRGSAEGGLVPLLVPVRVAERKSALVPVRVKMSFSYRRSRFSCRMEFQK